jgi:Ca2+/Na+ antiporter
MIVVNGLVIFFYGLVHDRLMDFFHVDSNTAKIIVIVGLVIAFLPLTLREEVYSRDTWISFFFFEWSSSETYKRLRLFGLIPLGQGDTISYRGTLGLTSGAKKVFLPLAFDVLPSLLAFIPVSGPLLVAAVEKIKEVVVSNN